MYLKLKSELLVVGVWETECVGYRKCVWVGWGGGGGGGGFCNTRLP